jgi:hypothetical protein
MSPIAFIRHGLPGLAILAIAGSVLAGPQRLAAETYKGKVTSVLESMLVMTDAGQQEVTLQVATSAKIQRNGRPAKLSDLQNGDSVTATVEVRGGRKVATQILALAAE